MRLHRGIEQRRMDLTKAANGIRFVLVLFYALADGDF